MQDFSHSQQQNGKFMSNLMFASVLLSSTCRFISIPEGKMLPNLVFLRKLDKWQPCVSDLAGQKMRVNVFCACRSSEREKCHVSEM